MKLYLLRHADAATVAAIDDERTLSAKGIKQSKRAAKFCLSHGLKPDCILSSPLIRAQQTAKPVASILKTQIETVPWLVYDTEPENVIAQLAARDKVESIMLVGHEPDFSRLVIALTGSENEAIRVRKGSLILLEVAEFRTGGARLEWSLPPKFM